MAQETAADSIEKLELQAAQSRWGDSTPAEGDPAGSGRCNLHTGCSHAILVSFRSRGVCADPYYIQLGGWGQWDQDWEQHQASGEVDTYSLPGNPVRGAVVSDTNRQCTPGLAGGLFYSWLSVLLLSNSMYFD